MIRDIARILNEIKRVRNIAILAFEQALTLVIDIAHTTLSSSRAAGSCTRSFGAGPTKR